MENKSSESCCSISKNNPSEIKIYFPLLCVFIFIILACALGIYIAQDSSSMFIMRLFSAFFFLTFGLLKLPNLPAFAKMFSAYDPIASKLKFYAYIYPFIELAIGYAYLRGIFILYASMMSLFVLSISNVGIAKALSRKQRLDCACIGSLFKLPISRLTIAENCLMILMSLWMILKLL